ncbi:hypothetical protein IB252_05400 [Pseudomonas sp. PDM10]|uniref:hypothetical protein n=1 Tax=Pseudomonas sp. PDM10 TaxID=2769269 RepID=UPI00177B4C73|nr:hypothetical protein [Pseudomonas sp. PDM10]MBD9599273.1 hypothetical protein [Pseudomonas sp. PDM10]
MNNIAKRLVLSISLAGLSGYSLIVLAANDGAFHSKRADINTQKSYGTLLEQLKMVEIWQALGSARDGGAAKSLQAYQKLSEIYSPLIIENGEPIVPIYTVDSLNLKDIDGFRAFASRGQFIPDENTCSAAMTFVFPRQIADLLSDTRPTYVYGMRQSNDVLEKVRSKRIEQGVEDLHYLKSLCVNQKDKNYYNGYINLYMNLQTDIKTILPVADQNYLASVAKQQAVPDPKIRPPRPFDLPKAMKFASCSALFTSFNQVIQSHGQPGNPAVTDGGIDMAIASVVYSNVDYLLNNTQPWVDKYTTEINANLVNIEAMFRPMAEGCVATYRANLTEINMYGDEAQAEFSTKAKALTSQ